jgi:hypothetical protein
MVFVLVAISLGATEELSDEYADGPGSRSASELANTNGAIANISPAIRKRNFGNPLLKRSENNLIDISNHSFANRRIRW